MGWWLVVIFVLAMLTLFVLSGGRTLPRPPLPNPNGYDDFLQAAALLTGDGLLTSMLDHDGLRAVVSTNSESLRLLRLGLTRHCAFPADSAVTNIPGLLGQFRDIKRLAQLLVAEGRLREMDNCFADAAQSYLDAIHLGNEISRGGFLAVRKMGTFCQMLGDIPLSRLVPKLNSQEARRTIAELEKLDSAGVTWDEVMRNENRSVQHQLTIKHNPFLWATMRWHYWPLQRETKNRHRTVIAHERLLAVELALRCYESEQGRAPTGLAQLVPQYLQREPIYPFNGRPVIYRPQGTNWLLYSVGPDGVDDGGKRVGGPVSGTVTRGDLFYDSPF